MINKGINLLKPAYIIGCVLLLAALVAFNKSPSTTVQTDEIKIAPTPPKSDVVVSKLKVQKLTLDGDRTILFDQEVNSQTAEEALQHLKHMERASDAPIYLLLDSPGGSVLDGAKIIAFIKTSRAPVYTVCIGVCASMAAQLHQIGTRRLMTDKSILMFHPAAGGVQGKVHEMKAILNMLDRYVERLDQEIAKRANIPYGQFSRMVVENVWVETADAVVMGLADGTVSYQIDGDPVRLTPAPMNFQLRIGGPKFHLEGF
jgi:ATP-dependent Clp protease, protease subunit